MTKLSRGQDHRPSFMTPSGNRRWFAASDSEDGPGMGEQVKIATANALLKSLLCSTDGFDAAFNGLKIVRMGDGEISCTLEVDAKLQNPFNTLHGGAICTLVDFASTLALMTQDPTRPGVSVDLGGELLVFSEGRGYAGYPRESAEAWEQAGLHGGGNPEQELWEADCKRQTHEVLQLRQGHKMCGHTWLNRTAPAPRRAKCGKPLPFSSLKHNFLPLPPSSNHVASSMAWPGS
eukprot:CAMPEP_0181319840 /NCGR_PEP_ID=MMETSP1101-20121128/17792_1 /TAXON_ID=46948 /ORGANISM="Rhodomonas abbreviata, Strain Caron Lab Isolate" /LENGTH=233 /DNA_ID=CAMNT_0023427479 /DNA_START=182 /DNA_END=882 /DNA_ORIENTATION=+